jgi:hypothetical protein
MPVFNGDNSKTLFNIIDERTKEERFSLMQIISTCIEQQGLQNRTLKDTKQRNQGPITEPQTIEYNTVYSLGS